MQTPLRLRIKKGSDGKVIAFAMHRGDGTVTVMRNPNPFFPVHDITHYAVETTLHARRAFYGLVAEGWDFTDFGSPWPRGPLPPDAFIVEQIVGMFDLERATGFPIDVDDLAARLVAHRQMHGEESVPVAVTPEVVERIRVLVQMLSERWRMTPAGEALELDYIAGAEAPVGG